MTQCAARCRVEVPTTTAGGPMVTLRGTAVRTMTRVVGLASGAMRRRPASLLARWACAGLAALTVALCLSPRVAGQSSYTLMTGGTANVDVGVTIPLWPVSADGSKLFFTTSESLLPSDTDSASDVYMSSNGTLTLISGGTANIPAQLRRMTRDGSRVFFTTTERLLAADIDNALDIYEWSAGTLKLITGGTADIPADFLDFNNAKDGISTDGSVVIFQTTEQLVPEDHNQATDVYKASGGVISLVSGGGTV